MADGSTKRIDNLTVTDVIWNPILKTPVLIKRVIKGEENLPLIEVGTSMKKVSVTKKVNKGTMPANFTAHTWVA